MPKNTSERRHVQAVLMPGDKYYIDAAGSDWKPTPPYALLGRRGKSSYQIYGFDTAAVLAKLGGNSSRMFWRFVSTRELETNLIKVGRDIHFTQTDRNRMGRVYKDLEKRRLLVRVQRDVYLINPKAMLPAMGFFERTWEHWLEVCQKRNIDPDPSFLHGVLPGATAHKSKAIP